MASEEPGVGMGFRVVPGRGGGCSLELSEEEAAGDWGGGGNWSCSEVGSGGMRSRETSCGGALPDGPTEALRGAGPGQGRGDRRRNSHPPCVGRRSPSGARRSAPPGGAPWHCPRRRSFSSSPIRSLR